MFKNEIDLLSSIAKSVYLRKEFSFLELTCDYLGVPHPNERDVNYVLDKYLEYNKHNHSKEYAKFFALRDGFDYIHYQKD